MCIINMDIKFNIEKRHNIKYNKCILILDIVPKENMQKKIKKLKKTVDRKENQ